MTSITYLYGDGRSRSRSHSRYSGPSLLGLAAASFLALRDQWRRRETEKLLEALPADIRKDIGWPAGDSRPAAR